MDQRLADEQSALRRLATLAAREASQAEVLGVIAEEIAHLIAADSIHILRYDRDDSAQVVASWGDDGDSLPGVGFQAKLGGNNATSRVFTTGQPARTDSYADASGPFGEAAKAAGSRLRSSVASPIAVEGKLWGVVIAGTASPEPMPPDTESRLTQFSDLVATAIANARSREALAELAEEQAALRRLATLIAQDVQPSEIFMAVSEEVVRLFGSAGGVLRFEHDSEVVFVGVARIEIPVGARWELKEGMASTEVHRTGRPARVEDVDWSSYEGPIGKVARRQGTRSIVGSPIVVEGRLWGAMIVSSNDDLLPSDTEERLEKFTELVATAVANAQSRESLAELADEQAALRRVATLVARDTRPSEIFSAVSEEVARLFKSIAGVLRFDHDSGYEWVGVTGVDIPIGTRWAFQDGMTAAEVYRTGRAARIEEMDWSAVDGPVGEAGRRLDIASTVASPIVVEDRLWGAMIVSQRGEGRIPPNTEERLERFTELIATAIANAETSRARTQLAEEQAALRRLATLVARDASPDAIFTGVCEEVARVFESGAGVLKFEDGSAVVFVAVANVEIPIGTRWQFQDGMASAEVYRTGRPARVEEVDWSSVDDPVGAASRRLGTRSTVGSPIVVEGSLWGAMIVSSRDDLLPPDTEQRLEKFTELIATAIANAETSRARAQLAEEQAALRRVAMLVAEGVPAPDLLAAVTREVARVFSDVAPSLVATVIRFDPGPECVLVGAAPDEREPIGTRWAPDDLYVSTRVLRTGRSARRDKEELEATDGPVADTMWQLGYIYQIGSPVIVDGRLWGAMTLNATGPLPPNIDQRLPSFVQLVATAIANAEDRSKLAASRKRLVAASDEARRQIERNLHDGTQQRLVSLALAAGAAAAQPPTQSSQVRDRFTSIANALGEAVEELQELSRGIHPAILTDAGLGPALESLALRSPIPVELRVMTRERFPEPVEVAAYFVASEALANATKHSQASRIDVALKTETDQLVLSVCDDGVGGADPGRGTGMVGLRDRVEALSGTLEITSTPARGTSLAATLPIRDETAVDAGHTG